MEAEEFAQQTARSRTEVQEPVEEPVVAEEDDKNEEPGSGLAADEATDAVVAKGDLSDASDWGKWKAEPWILTEEDLEAMLEDTDGPPSRIHGQADGPTDFSHVFNHGAGAAARGHGDVDEGDVADDNALDDDLEAMLEDTDVEVNHTLSIMLEDGSDNDKSNGTLSFFERMNDLSEALTFPTDEPISFFDSMRDLSETPSSSKAQRFCQCEY